MSILNKLGNIIHAWSMISRHPLTSGKRADAFIRWFRWQIGSRLVPGRVEVPFVNKTKLLNSAGTYGSTMNIYVGLGEYEEMSFVLHLCRSSDLFVDIGANVGAFTILVAGAVRARCVAVEPGLDALSILNDNIKINGLEDMVTICKVAASRLDGTVQFTANLDTLNHVVYGLASDAESVTTVEARSLDSLLRDLDPLVLKIDVEGAEIEVLEGASVTLSNSSVKAIIIEIQNTREGEMRGKVITERLKIMGFTPHKYSPSSRVLSPVDFFSEARTICGNVIFARDLNFVEIRLQSSPKYRINLLSRDL
jgi:FkbM family methyltransferase